MKKIIAAAAALAVVVVLILVGNGSVKGENSEFLRIHIRADSNEEEAQAVKYKVKTAIVDYLTPFLVGADTKSAAVKIVKSCLKGIESVSDEVLRSEGFVYSSRAKISAESFPTRTYDNVTLASGVYDALIVELGSGSGDNWWCVVYPPLCFVGTEGSGGGSYTVKSKLLEIIRSFYSSLEK